MQSNITYNTYKIKKKYKDQIVKRITRMKTDEEVMMETENIHEKKLNTV